MTLTGLLPKVVETVEVTHDPGSTGLFPEEVTYIAGAAARRRAEFAIVRHCARRALTSLGVDPAPIVPDEHRAPRWPHGVVGSLTHCDGYGAASVARTGDILTLGIDAETHEPLPDGVAELVTVGDEPSHLARLTADVPDVAWDRVLFSAKESIYKAWFPLTRTWLDFTECELTIEPDTGAFTGRLLVPGPSTGARTIEQFTGRWRVHENHVLTVVWERAQ